MITPWLRYGMRVKIKKRKRYSPLKEKKRERENEKNRAKDRERYKKRHEKLHNFYESRNVKKKHM